MKKLIILICTMSLCVMMSKGQSWISNSSMTATLDNSGVLTTTTTVDDADMTEYYQGASGYVKFNFLNSWSDSAYVHAMNVYFETVFAAKLGDGDLFYLEKIDDTRYLIRFRDEYNSGLYNHYVVPYLPNMGRDIHNILKIGVVDAIRDGDKLKTAYGSVVDLTNPNDYTYTFSCHETINGKSYYRINPEIISDLSSFGLEGPFYVAVNLSTGYLHVQGEASWSTDKAVFAIEEVSSPYYIDFGDEKDIRMYIDINPSNYLYEDASNAKGISFLGLYNTVQFPDRKDTFNLKKVGVSEGKILYTIYSGGNGAGDGGGYLTDATDLAFDGVGQDATVKNADYIYDGKWARLSFEAKPDSNSVFAFRRVRDNAFKIETAYGYVSIQNNNPVIWLGDLSDPISQIATFGFEEYESTGVEYVRPETDLSAYTVNGVLYIAGLRPGNPLSVYSIAGQLIYKGIAKAETEQVPVKENGIYIIVTGSHAIKAFVR